MRWSFRIGRVAGIDVYVHLTFLILLLWFAYSYYSARHDVADAARGVLFVLAVFGTVVLHELGHALAARRYGIQTRDITLLPIGGVARLERMPDEPLQELVVAAAGPLVNVVIAAGLYAGMTAASIGFGPPEDPFRFGNHFLAELLGVNVFLVVFNLIPAFPMDGGRVLRAVLAMATDYAQATQVAALVGQGFAFLFAVVGIFGIPGVLAPNAMLVFIALFVWMGAAGEASVAQLQSAIAGIPVRRAMIREFVAVRPDTTLKEVADHVLRGFQQDFPVVDGERVVGVLPQPELLAGLTADGPGGLVGRFMRADFETAAPNEMLDRALARLREGGCPVLPVLDGGQLVGLLTAENVGELVMIREAIRAGRDRAPRAVRAEGAEAVPRPASG